MMPGIESVVDIGCGVGTWLHVSMNKGIKEILGIDGTMRTEGIARDSRGMRFSP